MTPLPLWEREGPAVEGGGRERVRSRRDRTAAPPPFTLFQAPLGGRAAKLRYPSPIKGEG